MNFPERLKLIRNKQNKSMQEMADALGITRQGYSRYENSKASPTLESAQKLADALGVSLGYLLGITDENDKPIKHDEELIYCDEDFKVLSDTRRLVDVRDKERIRYDLHMNTEEVAVKTREDKIKYILENLEILRNWAAFADLSNEELINFVKNAHDSQLQMLYEYVYSPRFRFGQHEMAAGLSDEDRKYLFQYFEEGLK